MLSLQSNFSIILLVGLVSLTGIFSLDASRYSPFTNYFNNPYDYADAEAYGFNLFSKLIAHMNNIKREKDKCPSIPIPKTVLKHNYFNPAYEFEAYKFWYPPRDSQYMLLWTQLESYRSSLFMSYMLQNENLQFPPGWLYMYLSTAAQLHSLQSIGYNSHKIVKGIKMPFESNQVFRVNWWNNGLFQTFEKPFAIYATQPRSDYRNLVRVVDFGVGDYSADYTGHAFLNNYLYDRKQFLLNNTQEFSNFYKRPYQGYANSRRRKKRQEAFLKKSSNHHNNQQNSLQPYKNLVSDLSNPSNRYKNQQLFLQNQKLQNTEQISYLPPELDKVESLEEFSPFLYVNKQRIPITDWDPLVDTDRNNLERLPDRTSSIGFDQWYLNSLIKNTALDVMEESQQNPFRSDDLRYIETYRFAKPWWKNETELAEDQHNYVYRIKPDEFYYKFTGATLRESSTWSTPYFWCPDPTNWLVASMSPIWATNQKHYKNRIFNSDKPFRFVGLSEVVLNYEEIDINQCPGDRKRNVFASTALCDSTTNCLPFPLHGLAQGGYQCECAASFHYPPHVSGPYTGLQLINEDIYTYPLCLRSQNLLQYPNWISRNENEFILPSKSTSILQSYNIISKRSVSEKSNDDPKIRKNKSKKKRRKPRFIDNTNNFEKLRDLIYNDHDYLRRRCLSMPFQDIVLMREDDERFVLNLRSHADRAFRPQVAQAIRIAHVLSSYLQLYSPTSFSSVNSQNNFGTYINLDSELRPDPELDEYLVVGEVMSTLHAHYPLEEVSVFFNGTEFSRQKQFSSQKTLAFGVSMIKSEAEVFLNRSNDHSHLSKSWYMDASRRFRYGGGNTKNAGYYATEEEKLFYKGYGGVKTDGETDFELKRYSVEMSLRKSFDGLQGSVEVPVKGYDAAASGVWFGPYFDCQKRYMKTKTTLRMSYSVPIVYGTSKDPVGFVSVVVGSDLKWWKVNPCETTGGRNMFGGLHRCDQETTKCEEQHIPDFENGYYLASYKCVCKVNYEFPFIDYGSSFFEGSTVEKEYEKKVNGRPNIYDRLRCRPTNLRNDHWQYFNSAFSHHMRHSVILYIIICFLIFSLVY